jgi:hypothetical protein
MDSGNGDEWLRISHAWGEHYVEMLTKLTEISEANKTGRKVVIDKVLLERLKMFRKMIQVAGLYNNGHILSDFFQEKRSDNIGVMWWLNEDIPQEDYELPSMMALLGPGVIFPIDVRSWDWPDAHEHELISASDNLMTVYIGSDVTAIGNSETNEVFTDFNNLNCVMFELNSKCTWIARRAFYNCPSLRDVNFPESLRLIDHEAFRNTGLVTVDLPSNVDGIGNSAFKGCSSMKTLTMRYNDDLTVNNDAFQDCSELSIVNLLGGSPEQWKESFMTSDDIFAGCTKLEALRDAYKQPSIIDYLVHARVLETSKWEGLIERQLPGGEFVDYTFKRL